MNEENAGQAPNIPNHKVNLRIPEPEYPDLGPIIGEFLREQGMLPSDLERPARAEEPVRPIHVVLPPQFVKMMIAVATNAWQLKTRMTEGEGGEIKEEFKRLYRHVEAIFDSFVPLGLEVKDRTGEAFDYGLPEKVITSHPTPGITKERVIETKKPTIYFRGKILQAGEVVIATPESPSSSTQPLQ